ncbi:triose-phosphate isomerase family protein [Arthrobacter sp. ISL-69]|uniref:triose-phosphate isomerase family protein n=1 Tax=Arthrobacter sp. ISL-69 TaxID=2819113 RepID=UPI001BE7A1E5|nr:triose-phosphate isomerase family protein [Arthrobacter sp. ISL-69]MBT2538722.1 triosephosphate isomerase [Arthrobacter sp. ISL-69]
MSLPAKNPSANAGETATPKAIIGISLKMYFDYERTLDWCRDIADIAADHPAVRNGEIELFALPSHPVLAEAARILGPAGVATGAQDIFWEDEGAYTGEVGGKIITEVSGRYAEVGHAERRRVFGEDDDVIGLKTAASYRNGLTPVLCVGEPDRGTANDAVWHCIGEIDAVLNRAESLGQSGRTIVAYEPQWAIGAAEPATPSFISEVIRALDVHLRSRPAQADSRIIYGGSAGPGLIGQLDSAVAGLFLGRFAHDPEALRTILDETAERLGLLARTEATT